MVALAGPHLAAEHVIGPAGVGEDEGDDEQRADQREAQALRRPPRLAERIRRAG